MRRRISCFISWSFARMRSPRVFRLIWNFPARVLPQDEGETQEVEGLRFAESAPLAAFRRKAPELDDPELLGIQRQRKLLQPITHLVQEAPGIVLMLETDDEIVGIAHDDHITRGLAPSPACGNA